MTKYRAAQHKDFAGGQLSDKKERVSDEVIRLVDRGKLKRYGRRDDV